METKQQQPVNAAQLRVLRLIEVLAGHEVFGRRLTDIAHDMGIEAHTARRDLLAAIAAGWVRQRDDQSYCLATKPVQIATAFTWGIKQAHDAVGEIEQRYTRMPA